MSPWEIQFSQGSRKSALRERMDFPGGTDGKEFTCNSRDVGSIPGSGRSPGGRHGKTHSSILAWRVPWTEEPGGLQSMGLQRVRQAEATNTRENKKVIISLTGGKKGCLFMENSPSTSAWVLCRPVCLWSGWPLKACLRASTQLRAMSGHTEYYSGKYSRLVRLEVPWASAFRVLCTPPPLLFQRVDETPLPRAPPVLLLLKPEPLYVSAMVSVCLSYNLLSSRNMASARSPAPHSAGPGIEDPSVR